MTKKEDKDKEEEINMDAKITQETLEALAKKYNVKILPDDHPIYQSILVHSLAPDISWY